MQAEEFEARKVKHVGLGKDTVEVHCRGDLREKFDFKAAKKAIRA